MDRNFSYVYNRPYLTLCKAEISFNDLCYITKSCFLLQAIEAYLSQLP